MATTSVQLWERIHAAGLASPDDCRSWATEIAKSSSPELLQDPIKLAEALIRLGKLSPFQANVLFANLPIPIAFGPYRLTESLESALGSHWFQAIDFAKAKGSSLYCYMLTERDMVQADLRAWPPSLELAARQVEVSHPSLDHWLFAGIDRSNVVGFCERLQGQPLTQMLTDQPLSWQASVAMVEQIASGIQRMHEAGLVHGCICSESVWCVDDGEFVIRRDPIFPPANPYLEDGNSILVRSRHSMMEFAAPELTLPNAVPSVQSDVYALGCLWYRVITNNSPVGVASRSSPQEWSNAHLSNSIKPLDAAELPAPLQRCLAHLLAKNPSSRFETAFAAIKAIERAAIESERMSAVVATNKISEPSSPIQKSKPEPVVREGQIFVNGDEPTKAVPKVPSRSIGSSVRSNGSASKKKSKKKKKPAWVLPAMIGGSCLMFGVVITVLVRNGSTTVPNIPKTNLATSNATQVNPATENSNSSSQSQDIRRVGSTTIQPTESVTEYFAVDADDGQLLWAPPFAGSDFSLELFPAGVEAVVFASGNLWHGRGVASGIGKWWCESQPELVKEFARTPLLSDHQINSVAIALYPSKNPGLPQLVFRISFSQARTIDSLVQGLSEYKLQSFDPKNNGKKGFWSNSTQTNATSIVMDELQTDGAAMVKRVVIGPSELFASLPELKGSPAPLRRQLETLLKTTDARSDLTILAAPSFLFGDGREILSGVPKLQDALRVSLDESMQAVMFSTTIEPRWYMELRMLSSETRDVGKFASALKARLMGLADEFEKGLSSGVVLHPYWRAIGLRYPQMMRAMNRYLRIGLEDGQVVANVYLPTEAMNNLAIGSWMALNHAEGGLGSNVGYKPAPTTKPREKSIDEILDAKVTISFEQESLEAALQLIAGEVSESVLAGSGIAMTIDGTSFQKEGITRNQSIRTFKESAVPLRTVLTDLVRRANPVTTVQSPTERNQKVVWLVLDDPDRPGFKKIELTTRINAEAKKLTLPKEFVAE